MAESNGKKPPMRRYEALDVARGIAVLAMFWVHFVPLPDASANAWLARVQWASVEWLDGLPAAMFLVLIGLTSSLPRVRTGAYVVRRALILACIGLTYWCWFWPNDILLPIASMMLVLAAVQRLGQSAVVVAMALLLLSVTPAIAWWGDYAWTDVREDGTHEANHWFGWCTLRYFLIDGAYPLLPWLVFPLAGVLLARVQRNARVLAHVMVGCVVLVAAALATDHFFGDAETGGVYAHLDITWQPTSLPFVAAWGGAAILVIAGLLRWAERGALPSWCASVAAVGRLSLTHYLLHTIALYGALRVWWPGEDWPSGVGVAAAVGYGAFALVVTPRWLSTGRRGPIEALLAMGARRSAPATCSRS